MSGRVTIEYDACVVVEKEGDRLSDLNCFWMASDPRHPDNIWKREKWRSGIFLNCYSLQLYYMGYGGNYNSTTRFRRYDGNEAGITDPKVRPAILKEYTDTEHLLKANHWYHIKITNENNRISYYIDGKRLVDFRDAEPLTEGWFGFRTTLSRTRITNFRYECLPSQTSTVPLHWIGNTPEQDKAVSFGVPFDEGYLFPETSLRLKTDRNQEIPVDTWPLAYWPDGSVKWSGVAGVIPAGTERLTLEKAPRKAKTINKQPNASIAITETPENIQIETGLISVFIPRHGDFLIDSLLYKGTKVGEKARLICNTQSEPIQENIAQVAPDQHAGQEAAQEADAAYRCRTDGHADQTVLERLGNRTGQAQQGEGQHIVQQDHTHQRQQAGSRGRVEAQQHLQQAVDKAREQSPFCAVAVGDQDERQHAQQGDGAAVGHLKNFDVRQHGAQGDHQGALHKSAGLGIGFGHGIHSSKNVT